MPQSIEQPPPNVTPPDLTFSDVWTTDTADPAHPRWTAGPDITVQVPAPPTGDGEDEGPTTTVHVNPFTVSTGSVVEQVKLMLADLKTQVESYTSHKTYVQDRENWIFSVASAEDVGPNGAFYGVTVDYYEWVVTGPYNSGHHEVHQRQDYFGASPAQVEQINTYQHQLLMAAADIITLIGQYTLSVDAAAQTYANVDFACQFPDPPTITEIF
jgi:hypothetical protein